MTIMPWVIYWIMASSGPVSVRWSPTYPLIQVITTLWRRCWEALRGYHSFGSHYSTGSCDYINMCLYRFTDDQLFLVMCRVKFLSYLDRLSLMQVHASCWSVAFCTVIKWSDWLIIYVCRRYLVGRWLLMNSSLERIFTYLETAI